MLCMSSTAMGAPKLASHYAPLFEKGKTFRYQLSVVEFDLVERKDGSYKSVKMKPVLSTFTCTVAEVITFTEAIVSSVQCDREIDPSYGFRPDGMWVATKAGAWRAGGATDTLPASAAEIEMQTPTMRKVPQLARKRTKDDFGGHFTETVTSPRPGTWCANSDTTMAGAGDGAIETTCFTAGAGITRGRFDYYGGTPRIIDYKLK